MRTLLQLRQRTTVPGARNVVFQCTNGVVLGLFSETVYERRFGNAAGEFCGFTLAINCEDATAVFRAHEEVAEFDDVRDFDDRPDQSGWGCGFSFWDPEGNVWEVAWKAGSEIDDRDGFIYP